VHVILGFANFILPDRILCENLPKMARQAKVKNQPLPNRTGPYKDASYTVNGTCDADVEVPLWPI